MALTSGVEAGRWSPTCPSQVNCYLTRSRVQVNSASKQLNNDNQLRADHELIFEITKKSGNA